MFSTANKTTKTAPTVQQTAGTTFFRKAGDERFFGAKENPSFFKSSIQAKLTVSTPDDPQEKEADEVADKVMRMAEPVAPVPLAEKNEEKLRRKEYEEEEVRPKLEQPVANKIRCKAEPKEILQAKAATCSCGAKEDTHIHAKSETENNVAHNGSSISLYPSDVMRQSGRGPPTGSIPFEQTLASSKGGGSALPGDTKAFMESRFNADFSGVRVHTDSTAASLSRGVNAQAFAHGNDIYFNSGKFSPDSTAGKTLLAHELTHTVQQGASKSNTSSFISRKSVSKKSIYPCVNKSVLSTSAVSTSGTVIQKTFPRGEKTSIHKKDDAERAGQTVNKQINTRPKPALSGWNIDAKGSLHKSPQSFINKLFKEKEASKTEKEVEKIPGDTQHDFKQIHIQTKEKSIQLKPADYRHPEDGNRVKQRMHQGIDQAVKKEAAPDSFGTTGHSSGRAIATDRNNQSLRNIDRGEIRKQKNALQGQARPDVNRAAQEHSKVAQTASKLKQAVNKPIAKKGEVPKGKKGNKQAISAAENAVGVARQVFSSARSLQTIAQPVPPVSPPAIPEPVDSAGMALPANPEAETQVAQLAQQANALRMGGHRIRMLARQELQNALLMQGNIQLVQGQLQQAEQGINQSNDHLAFRQDLMGKANQSLTVSEQKAVMVAAESPNVVAKADEGKEESGPMTSEARQLSSENAANTPEDEEAAANSREQGGKINQTGSDIATTDGAIAQTRTRAEGLGAEAAQATQLNSQSRGQIDTMNQRLTQTGQKLNEMSGQTSQAKSSINGLSSQPARLTQQAQQLDQQGLNLINASQDIEASLHRTQQNYQAGMRAVPKLRPLPPPQNEEAGVIQRQAGAASAGVDWLASNEGRYEDRRNLDLTGRLANAGPSWLTGVDPVSEQQREQARVAEEERRRTQIEEINRRAGGNFASLSAMDKAGIALSLTGRNLFGSVSNIKWPGWGHLAAGLIDPRGPMMGVVGGLSMMLSGGANLLSGEQWARDPLGNLLKSAADIATGLTIILGSITALAGVIAAIMAAITILSLGVAAPVTGPIISFCATVMITVGGWTIAVGKVALVLQALVFIKNLIDAATASTAEQLQNNADQMTQDASNAGNVVLQIGIAKLAQIGGRQIQSGITTAGGATAFAKAMPARLAVGARAVSGKVATGIGAVGRGIASGVRATAGKVAAGVKSVGNTIVRTVRGQRGLIQAGNAADRGGFTLAGRALQKHGSRPGSAFPKTTGNPAAINAQGEAVLNGIITNPNAVRVVRHHANFGEVLEVRIPGGQGARFSSDGTRFIGYLEP